MKDIVKKVNYRKEYETKFGVMHQFEIVFGDKRAYYTSKTKDQKHFIPGQEAEFELEEKEGTDGSKFFVVKVARKQWGNSQYGKALKREQSKYSGFAVSYVKDLIIADKLPIAQWKTASKDIFDFMVALDKSIETND